MKKLIIVSALVMACTTAIYPQNAFASSYKKKKIPDRSLVKVLHQDFPQVIRAIHWTRDRAHYIARFNSGNRRITAIYNNKEELLSTLIYSHPGNIPFEIQTNLVKEYPGFTVQCMKEWITKDDHNYYFILKNQQGDRENWLSVKSDGNSHFTILQKLHETV